jgi:pimeloyl-ACP methyl ester carboxylesterase
MKSMAGFASYDGTEIGYRVLGDGLPLVCLPGGPGRAAEYLGDLGGLGRSRRLVLWDPRGVGVSADPADPATFRVDRLVEDVESLRVHLGLDQMDLLAHSAGAVLAMLYAVAYPQHVSRASATRLRGRASSPGPPSTRPRPGPPCQSSPHRSCSTRGTRTR